LVITYILSLIPVRIQDKNTRMLMGRGQFILGSVNFVDRIMAQAMPLYR